MMIERKVDNPDVARVDHLVDENGSPVDVPDNSRLEVASEGQPVVGATSPTNWWRLGLIALGIVALMLLLLQLFGGSPGTDVVPGTPVAEPAVPVE